jgi:predicted nucleic acid-binding protein
VKAIADTGFLVAFANRRDTFFPWAFELAQRVNEPLLTCEAVLAETAFHLRDAALVLRMLETGLVRIDFEIARQRKRLGELATQFRDQTPDLADLCLICMSEKHPRHPIITLDGEFKVYRRNRREKIPLMMPPGS